MTDHHPNTPLLTLAHLSKTFGQSLALSDASLTLFPGEILAIVGPSGCGKSTLLKLISGFETPDSGDIVFNNTHINALAPEKRGIGMVFQDYALFPHMNALDNVIFALHKEKDKSRKRDLAYDYLKKLNMASFAERFPHELSGGQQQRVAIARTLAAQPDLILLDEPFSSIDESTRAHARQEIRAVLRHSGISVIMVTHDCKEALSFADKVCVIKSGKIQQIGTPEDLYFAPKNTFVAQFIAPTNIIPAHIHQGHLSCCLGQFNIENTEIPPHETKQVNVSIRPESLLLSAENKADTSELLATVIHQEFTGDAYFYTLALQETKLLVRCPVTQKYKQNERVIIKVQSPSTLIVLTQE